VSNGALPGGVPRDSDQFRAIVDEALILSRIPNHLEPTSGGISASQRLGDYLEQSLTNLYTATSAHRTKDEWLGAVLGITDFSQLRSQGPMALARQLDATAGVAEPIRELVPMTEEEDTQDRVASKRARDRFATIPDRPQ
jgi:hypothetical protein